MVKEKIIELTTNELENKKMIHEIHSFIPIAKQLKLATKDTLVIFDVDDVLTMPVDDDNFKHPYRTQLWQSIRDRLMPKKADYLYSNILSVTKRTLVEPCIVDIFNHLKLQQIPTIALTAMGTGGFGVVNKMEDIRIKELNNVGISFLPLTPLKGEHLAVELKNTNIVFKHCTGAPMLKDGIIFTAGVDKAVVLEYMINKYNYCPKTIVFIDDDLKNLESLKKLCIKLKIDFYGFHYKAVSLMPLPDIDENLERLRFNILEQDGVWLSCKQVKKRHIKSNDCYPLEITHFLSLQE